MEKDIRKENGITLIALVITIIVTLILVGAAVSRFTNEGGFLSSISGIKQESKLQLENASADTEEDIEDKVDIAEGEVEKKLDDIVSLECIDKWSTYLTVKLDIGSYNFEGGEFGIENIKYGIKEEGSTSYKEKKTGESKYICKLEGLTPGTTYIIDAIAIYKDNNNELQEKIIKSTNGITTYKWAFKVGDWVNYDAGTWTEEEINNLDNQGLYYANYTAIKNDITQAPINCKGGGTTFNSNKNKFSGMTVGYDKNSGQSSTKTSYYGKYVFELGSNSSEKSETSSISAKNATQTNGWRVLNISDSGNIEIVSTGIPEYFIGKCLHMTERHDHFGGGYGRSNKFYVEENLLKTLQKREFSEYINSTYADNARLMNRNDAIKAQTVTTLSNIGCTYILGTVRAGDSYKTIDYAINNNIFGTTYSQLLMANNDGILKLPKSTNKNDRTGDNYCFDSAGVLGVRIVITLKPDIIPTNIDENGNATLQGTYSSPLRLANKSELDY